MQALRLFLADAGLFLCPFFIFALYVMREVIKDVGGDMFHQLIAIILSMLTLFCPCYVYAANELPIETHNLLGNPVLMDYMTCVQRYGQDFCRCMELDGGTTACYYQRPPAGYYTQERCEQIWGPGHCEEVTTISPPENWKLKDSTREAGGSQCSGQVMIFPGEKDECRSKTGLIGLGGSCCWQDTGQTCSFENTAETLGWDAAVINAVKKATEYLAKEYVQPMMTDWMNDVMGDVALEMFGSSNPVYSTLSQNAFNSAIAAQEGVTNLTSSAVQDAVTNVSTSSMEMAGIQITGDTMSDLASQAADAYAEALAQTGSYDEAIAAYANTLTETGTIPADTAMEAAGNYAANTPPMESAFSNAVCGAAISGVVSVSFALLDGQLTAEELQNAATSMLVSFSSAYIPAVGWAYTAYQMYNMLTAETECLPFEYTLACKVGEGYCHYVGERCTSKIFGHCIAKKKVYCCFNSLLARVVHEQGRPQIGLDWGTAKHPKCRGFYPDEFAELNFQEMDLSEFVENIQRRVDIDIQTSIDNAIERFENRINPPDGGSY